MVEYDTIEEDEYFKSRRFQIVVPVREPEGTVVKGGHPGCMNRHILTNLRASVKTGSPVLSGVLSEGQLISLRGGIQKILMYQGHVFESFKVEEIKEALNKLAMSMGAFLDIFEIRVSLGKECWVISRKEV